MSTPKAPTNPFGQLYHSIRTPRQSHSEKIKNSEPSSSETIIPQLSPRITSPWQKSEKGLPSSSETIIPQLSPRISSPWQKSEKGEPLSSETIISPPRISSPREKSEKQETPGKLEKIGNDGKSEKQEISGKLEKSEKLEKPEQPENQSSPSNLEQEPRVLTASGLGKPCFRSSPHSWRSSQIVVNPVDPLSEEEYMSELPMDQVILTLQKTKPCSHWYFRENQKWHPYSAKMSQELETSYFEKKEKFNLDNIEFDMKRSSSKKEGASKEKKLLRATWFYNSDNATKTELTWSPYEEAVANKLEQAIEDGFASKRVEVSDKPKRYVVLHVGGTFKQYRDTPNAKEGGRMVWRGWEGRCTKK